MAHWKKRETLFAEYGFRFALPGHWQLRPSDEGDRWLYRSADRKEQVTVIRAELPSGGNGEEAAMRRAVARHRKTVELGFDREPDLEMTEFEFDERGGLPMAFYSGTADHERHRFWALLLFSERTVWSFFYETFSVPEAEAAARADAALQTVVFKEGR